MELSNPLVPDQILAAKRLHDGLDQWQATDRALVALAEKFPGFEPEATLLKVVAVNALYGTNLYATARMASHAQKTIHNTGLKNARAKFVECLARLPETRIGKQARRHYSFASKFAHFFIDKDRFPIMDAYAENMLRFHLGASNTKKDPDNRYVAFVHNFRKLGRLALLQGTTRELDHYLWLAGLYRKWRKNRDMRINVEVRQLFSGAAGQTEKDLKALLAMN